MVTYNTAHPLSERGARVTKACEVCGTEFTYYPAVRPSARYCSRKCKGVGHTATMTGRRYVEEYTSHNTFRVMVRRYFIPGCALCGWDEANCDVCHIIARKHGGSDDVSNVILLCPNHHRVFDRGLIPVEKVRAARAASLLSAAH